MPTFAPYIYNAYGPGTKLIITDGARPSGRCSREWDTEFHFNDTPPRVHVLAIAGGGGEHVLGNQVKSYARSPARTPTPTSPSVRSSSAPRARRTCCASTWRRRHQPARAVEEAVRLPLALDRGCTPTSSAHAGRGHSWNVDVLLAQVQQLRAAHANRQEAVQLLHPRAGGRQAGLRALGRDERAGLALQPQAQPQAWPGHRSRSRERPAVSANALILLSPGR